MYAFHRKIKQSQIIYIWGSWLKGSHKHPHNTKSSSAPNSACARMALCTDGSGSGTYFHPLSLGLVCGPPLPMWNMFIVLCVRQTPRPPRPPSSLHISPQSLLLFQLCLSNFSITAFMQTLSQLTFTQR